jgi:hypothetical protein
MPLEYHADRRHFISALSFSVRFTDGSAHTVAF